jgi:hydrogenase expression/formation protein HypD
VVFFASGFETTSPLVAGTLAEAEQKKIDNFYIHPVLKTVPPALRALLQDPALKIDGFILPGHVTTIIGLRPYGFISSEFRKPAVVAGFDAADILNAILMLLQQIKDDNPSVQNGYPKVVREEGNPRAVSLLNEFFEPADAYWRGIGTLRDSGLVLREKYAHRDIAGVVDVQVADGKEPAACSCGDVLKGIKIPTDCPLFGKVCTPDKPVGACMVSTEGSCAAYYKYKGISDL